MSSNSGWPQAVPETPPLPASAQVSGAADLRENPPWNGWDVARIGLLMFVVPYLLIPFAGLAAQRLFYRSLPWITVAQKPWLALSTQFIWYAVVAVYMIVFVEGRFHQSFWEAVRWNWPPRRNWPFLVLLGMILVSLQSLVRFFHVPKHMPMEEFLSTPIAAFMTGVLAISLGPLMEELFFRGFLYPVVARRFGVISGVVATSIAFGFIHAAQLAFAWGLVFIIFLVGAVLTIVRAKTRSVGSSLLVHVAYNSTLVVSGVLSSHHLDKIVH
jgi:membrane protease YdiL (CAAX protease family)